VYFWYDSGVSSLSSKSISFLILSISTANGCIMISLILITGGSAFFSASFFSDFLLLWLFLLTLDFLSSSSASDFLVSVFYSLMVSVSVASPSAFFFFFFFFLVPSVAWLAAMLAAAIDLLSSASLSSFSLFSSSSLA